MEGDLPEVGLQRSAANERWPYALCVIAMKLNRQPVPKNRSRRYVIERVRDFADETPPDQAHIVGRNCLKLKVD